MKHRRMTLRRAALITGALLAAVTFIAFAAGCDRRLDDAEAAKIAGDVIAKDFPDMVDAEQSVQSYQSEGREFYEVAYGKMVEYQTGGGMRSAPRIVVVTVDRNTGETIVAVSD